MQKPDSGILQKLGVQKLDVFAFNLTQLGFNLLYLHASGIQEYSLYFHAVNPNKKQVEEWRLLTAAVFCAKTEVEEDEQCCLLNLPAAILPTACDKTSSSYKLLTDVFPSLRCALVRANLLKFAGIRMNHQEHHEEQLFERIAV